MKSRYNQTKPKYTKRKRTSNRTQHRHIGKPTHQAIQVEGGKNRAADDQTGQARIVGVVLGGPQNVA